MPTASFIRVQVQFFRQKAAAPTAVAVDAMGKAEPGIVHQHTVGRSRSWLAPLGQGRVFLARRRCWAHGLPRERGFALTSDLGVTGSTPVGRTK